MAPPTECVSLHRVSAAAILLLLLLVGVSHSAAISMKAPLQNFRAYNIAHRGSSGELPEETAEAYQRAIQEGADFIETDLMATKDGVLICLHDATLDDTTNIADHPEFADRKATYEIEGQNATGYFTVDFTLAEIKTLRTRQRLSFRDQSFNDLYQIITFEEYINIALNASRTVGIYPELKNPVFLNKHVKFPQNKRLEDVFAETLQKHGYGGKFMSLRWRFQPVFIQSFAPSSLIYLHNVTELPKILLLDSSDSYTQDTNQSFAELTSNQYLDYISSYVVGIGPWKDTIVVPDSKNYLSEWTGLVSRAHERRLQVHPYTFRNENKYLHFDFHQDPYQEYSYWIHKVGVDGLFTDFPGSLAMYQNSRRY